MVKTRRQKPPRRNLEHITCNYCGEKGHYGGNRKLSIETKIKYDKEAFIKMKQGNFGIKPPDGGGEKKHWLMLRMHHAVPL